MKNANYKIERMEITEETKEFTYGIALGYNEKSNMWVTWSFKINEDNYDEIDYFWGHYFERERDALVDYHQRIIDELK